MKKKGRKSLLTPAFRKRILSLLERGHTIRNACAAVGISERVFYDWCEKNAAFSADVQRARAAGRVQIVERILKSPDWRALSWYLSVTDPEQFGRVAERNLPVDLAQPAEPVRCEIIVRDIPEEHRKEPDALTTPARDDKPKLAIVPQVPSGVFEFKRTT